MDVANNDVEDEEMLEDAPPVIVNYAKYDNRITVFQGQFWYQYVDFYSALKARENLICL